MPPRKPPAYPHVETNPKKLVRNQQSSVISAMRYEMGCIQSALNFMRNGVDDAVKAATKVEKNIDELTAAWDNEVEHRHLEPTFWKLPELRTSSINQYQDAMVRLEGLMVRYNELRKIFKTLAKR